MCGFIGIYGPDGVDVAGELYEGLLAVQHRGQDAAGMITFTDAFHVKKGLGLVLEIFNENNMSRLRGNLGVGHVRYPTVGSSRKDDAQPFHAVHFQPRINNRCCRISPHHTGAGRVINRISPRPKIGQQRFIISDMAARNNLLSDNIR